MATPYPDRQNVARGRIAELFRQPSGVFVIHYACQSFYHGQQLKSPRVTAIVARNLGTGHSETFSLHTEAELLGLTPVGVLARMDWLERNLLDKFFRFLVINRGARFVHWKMRDATFGFAAIEHRYAVLGGQPVTVPDQQRTDLAWLLEEIYGTDYIETPHFESLAKLNRLPIGNFLSGAKEAQAFQRSDYLAVQRSTTTKVGLFFDILRRAHDRTLKTRTEASGASSPPPSPALARSDTSTAARIFLNYRRGDDPGSTGRLYDRLEAEFGRPQLFMDVEGHIRGGDDFVEVLRAQVARCDVFLAIIGPRWLTATDERGGRRIDNPDDWVRIEIEGALQNRKRVIPVLVGGAGMPRADDLPSTLRPLARRQAIRISVDRFNADALGLAEQIRVTPATT